MRLTIAEEFKLIDRGSGDTQSLPKLARGILGDVWWNCKLCTRGSVVCVRRGDETVVCCCDTLTGKGEGEQVL